MMSVMLKIGGKPWRCPCGANVLTHNSDETYTCNGCQRTYAGEGYVEPAPAAAPTDHTAAIAEKAREWRDTLDPSVSMADHAAAGDALIAAVDAERADREPGCTCVRCAPNYHLMRGCPTCGNKRCPKVSEHDNRCTGSNEPGQIPERPKAGA